MRPWSSGTIPSFVANRLFLACERFHEVLSEHIRAAELDSCFHQLQDYVFSILTDDPEVLQINDGFATVQVCCGSLARTAQLSGTRAISLPSTFRDFYFCLGG